MQDEQSAQTDDAVEPTAEDATTDPEAGAGAVADDTAQEGVSADDVETADAVDTQASPGGAGETVLRQPEVPDDANDTIAAAQEHINSLNMDQEREAAERAQKQM